jgi:hypothetical protein
MPKYLNNDDLVQHIRSIESSGFTIIPKVIGEFEINRLLGKIKSLLRNGQAISSESGISPNQLLDNFVYHLQFLDIDFIRLLSENSDCLNIIGHFLNDPNYRKIPIEVNNFLLAYYNARSSVKKLDFHIDNYIPSSGYFPNSMQMIVSLNGQSRENGGSFVVPGSHKYGRFPEQPFGEILDIVCEPGDVIIWDSRIWHGAHENSVLTDRWSLIATFRPWWAKQNYDPSWGFSDEMFRLLTDYEKLLVGFLSIPPKDQSERINLKQGFLDLRSSVLDYR